MPKRSECQDESEYLARGVNSSIWNVASVLGTTGIDSFEQSDIKIRVDR